MRISTAPPPRNPTQSTVSRVLSNSARSPPRRGKRVDPCEDERENASDLQGASVRHEPMWKEVAGGGRDSNPRPPGPQPGALPTELPPPRSGTEDSRVDVGTVLDEKLRWWLCVGARRLPGSDERARDTPRAASAGTRSGRRSPSPLRRSRTSGSRRGRSAAARSAARPERSPDSSSSFAPITWAIVVFWMMFTSRLTIGGSRRRSACGHDHEGVAADPAEAERRRGLVLLARDRLDRAARRLGHLCASPEGEPDRRRGQRLEPQVHADRRQREVDDEDRHQDREPAPDLDVGADERPAAAGT